MSSTISTQTSSITIRIIILQKSKVRTANQFISKCNIEIHIPSIYQDKTNTWNSNVTKIIIPVTDVTRWLTSQHNFTIPTRYFHEAFLFSIIYSEKGKSINIHKKKKPNITSFFSLFLVTSGEFSAANHQLIKYASPIEMSVK